MPGTMKAITKILTVILLSGFSTGLSAQTTVSQDIYIVKGAESRRAISTVSGDISIGSVANIKSNISTVSGDIEIGAKAKVEQVATVSGDISVGKGARTHSLETVSGDIHLYSRSDVLGSIETVSGDLICDTGCDIRKGMITVSGDIELDDTRLRGNLKTVSGDISLFNGAVIDGDIIISRKRNFMSGTMGKLEVIIDMNSIVKGNIRVEESETNVMVYLTNGGQVKGEIINAEVRKK